MERAACVGKDPELFFPSQGQWEQAARARAVCATCPVIGRCRDHAEALNPEFGIWAGESRPERRKRRQGERAA